MLLETIVSEARKGNTVLVVCETWQQRVELLARLKHYFMPKEIHALRNNAITLKDNIKIILVVLVKPYELDQARGQWFNCWFYAPTGEKNRHPDAHIQKTLTTWRRINDCPQSKD